MTVPAEAARLTTRHADLGDLAALLREQQARKVDVVTPPSALRARGGMLVIADTEPVLTDTGVDLADGIYRPTAVCDEGISDKLGIDLRYLRQLREQAIDLYDVNVNGWLDRSDPGRRFLVRCFRGQTGHGVAKSAGTIGPSSGSTHNGWREPPSVSRPTRRTVGSTVTPSTSRDFWSALSTALRNCFWKPHMNSLMMSPRTSSSCHAYRGPRRGRMAGSASTRTADAASHRPSAGGGCRAGPDRDSAGCAR
jgi:hypothetical protein